MCVYVCMCVSVREGEEGGFACMLAVLCVCVCVCAGVHVFLCVCMSVQCFFTWFLVVTQLMCLHFDVVLAY